MLNNKLVIGTAQFGLDYGISNQKGKTSLQEAHSILDVMKRKNLFELDTAKTYGDSEKVLGLYFKNNPQCDWNVTTKITEMKNSIVLQLKDSEKKLFLKPNILLAHTLEIFQNSKFQLSVKSLKKKKLVKKMGVSLYSEDEVKRVISSSCIPDIIQLPMNILDTRLYRRGVIDKICNSGIEVHIRSVFLQGLFYLSNKMIKKNFIDAYPYLIKLKKISRKENLSLSELSLLWLYSLNEVDKVIIGVNNLFQLKSHLKTLSKKLSKSVIDEALAVCYDNEEILNPSLWKS